MVSPEDFKLPKNWDKKLKIQFSKSQKEEIEHLVDRYIVRHLFNQRGVSFDQIEYRLNQIIDGASLILKGYPYPHHHYTSDPAHVLIEQELSFKLSDLNGKLSDEPSMIMHHVVDLKLAASAALKDFKDRHPVPEAKRPSNENADWLIYDLGILYEKAGGKFSMPEEPSLKHGFYNFLLAINVLLAESLKLNESDLINRSIKLIKGRKKATDRKKVSEPK